MGVGISAHRLAGAVAREGGVGTIASIDLRHHHADLVAATEKSHDKDAINAANLVALDREIRAAREGAHRRGLNLWSIWSDHRALSVRTLEILESVSMTAQAALPVAGLPHGDQRKLEVALLMALEPSVYMFDEPTAGMAPAAALRAATSGAATILGWPKAGIVAPGYWGDAVLVDGDPLADVGILANRARVHAVIKGGVLEVDRRPES